MIINPKELSGALRDHVVQDILPFWRRYSIDRKNGGYNTTLARDGSPSEDAKKNLSMQARMIDAFTAGSVLADRTENLACARHGFDFLSEVMYSSTENRWFTVVEKDGTPEAEYIRAFDLTAVVHALSNFSVMTGDGEPLAMAVQTFEQLELFFRDKTHGGYFDRLDSEWRVERRTKSLDVHLHAIEAMFALIDAMPGESDCIQPLRRTLDLLMKKTNGEIPIEKYTHDWLLLEDHEPVVHYGHLFKAAWLYLEAYRRTRVITYLEFARHLLEHAIRFGLDPTGKGVFETGTPNGEMLNARHTWWAQCNAIAALSRAWAMTGEEEYGTLLARLTEYCFKNFSDPQYGEWFALLGSQNEVLDPRKGHDRKCAYPLVQSFVASVADLASCKMVVLS